MKKVLVLVLAMVASASATFAVNPGDYDVFYKLNDQSTLKSLVRYLKVNNVQTEQLKNVFSVTENELKSALKSEDEVAGEKAISSNFSSAKKILSNKQYIKYFTVVNLTISNKYYDVLLTEK